MPGVELFKTQRGMTSPTDVPTLEKIHPLLRPPHNVVKKNQFLNTFPFLLKRRHKIDGDKTQDCGRRWWMSRARVDSSVRTISLKNTRITSDILHRLWAKLGARPPFTLHQSEVVTTGWRSSIRCARPRDSP